MVQKTIIDSLQKESKSQRGITERGGCSRSAVSKHIKCKVDWKEENVQKQQRWSQAWEYCQAKLIQTLGSASQRVNWSWIKSHHAQTSSGKELPTTSETETSSEASYLGYGEKELDCCSVSKALFSDEGKLCISFGPRVWRKRGETQNPCFLKSSVKFHSLWWFELPCHLLELVYCVLSSPKSTQPSTRNF